MSADTLIRWIPYDVDRLPAKDQRVEWVAPSGQTVRGTYLGGIVWLPEDSTTYIYYTPSFWRPL